MAFFAFDAEDGSLWPHTLGSLEGDFEVSHVENHEPAAEGHVPRNKGAMGER